MEWHKGKLRQRPGSDNALGGVKFAFPNPYSMYLHDTPAKGLFKQERRAFSHGCIRVAAPDTLAYWLLRGQEGWDYEQIHGAMGAGSEKWVTLKKPTIIYVYYLTAFVDPQGNLNFRKDVYNRDQTRQKKG
jgi:murein L,D-transpeptidase YcbB/YkuD